MRDCARTSAFLRQLKTCRAAQCATVWCPPNDPHKNVLKLIECGAGVARLAVLSITKTMAAVSRQTVSRQTVSLQEETHATQPSSISSRYSLMICVSALTPS
jgi:hypothetical protein